MWLITKNSGLPMSLWDKHYQTSCNSSPFLSDPTDHNTEPVCLIYTSRSTIYGMNRVWTILLWSLWLKLTCACLRWFNFILSDPIIFEKKEVISILSISHLHLTSPSSTFHTRRITMSGKDFTGLPRYPSVTNSQDTNGFVVLFWCCLCAHFTEISVWALASSSIKVSLSTNTSVILKPKYSVHSTQGILLICGSIFFPASIVTGKANINENA